MSAVGFGGMLSQKSLKIRVSKMAISSISRPFLAISLFQMIFSTDSIFLVHLKGWGRHGSLCTPPPPRYANEDHMSNPMSIAFLVFGLCYIL